MLIIFILLSSSHFLEINKLIYYFPHKSDAFEVYLNKQTNLNKHYYNWELYL